MTVKNETFQLGKWGYPNGGFLGTSHVEMDHDWGTPMTKRKRWKRPYNINMTQSSPLLLPSPGTLLRWATLDLERTTARRAESHPGRSGPFLDAQLPHQKKTPDSHDMPTSLWKTRKHRLGIIISLSTPVVIRPIVQLVSHHPCCFKIIIFHWKIMLKKLLDGNINFISGLNTLKVLLANLQQVRSGLDGIHDQVDLWGP